MDEYTTLSGETIDVSTLTNEENIHIGEVEKLIENSEDYFDVYRCAFVRLKEGEFFTPKDLHELEESSRYKVVSDLVERYRQRVFLQSVSQN